MFCPSECTSTLCGIETLIGQKNEVFHRSLSVKHLAWIVPVDFAGIWREASECTIEFIFRDEKSGKVFISDVVTKAVKRRDKTKKDDIERCEEIPRDRYKPRDTCLRRLGQREMLNLTFQICLLGHQELSS